MARQTNVNEEENTKMKTVGVEKCHIVSLLFRIFEHISAWKVRYSRNGDCQRWIMNLRQFLAERLLLHCLYNNEVVNHKIYLSKKFIAHQSPHDSLFSFSHSTVVGSRLLIFLPLQVHLNTNAAIGICLFNLDHDIQEYSRVISALLWVSKLYVSIIFDEKMVRKVSTDLFRPNNLFVRTITYCPLKKRKNDKNWEADQKIQDGGRWLVENWINIWQQKVSLKKNHLWFKNSSIQ